MKDIVFVRRQIDRGTTSSIIPCIPTIRICRQGSILSDHDNVVSSLTNDRHDRTSFVWQKNFFFDIGVTNCIPYLFERKPLYTDGLKQWKRKGPIVLNRYRVTDRGW